MAVSDSRGDLSAGGQWVFGITLLGKVSRARILQRGARAGDNLWSVDFLAEVLLVLRF